MEKMQREKIVEVLTRVDYGASVLVKGWVRSRRGNKTVQFIVLNDGSCMSGIQIVADLNVFQEEAQIGRAHV